MSERDGGGNGRAVVRRARAEDVGRVVELVAEHAEYEKSAPPAPGLATRLTGLLFGGEAAPGDALPRLRCLVAELPDGSLAGYATCAPELSTWDGVAYLHMDCLYLTSTARGHGLGPLLMDAVRAEARTLGLTEIQWQTPAWNEGAIRFYDRLGATSKEKRRYTLPVDPAVPASDSASGDGE
ncbi:GNAT family N-acetyltransferase [Streptomyces sp. NPDC056943]|uniref:GNAT family N-acetyltransferase n=1 Tax=Streptomyces sp. NPDC056943 TaxID=3345971 RepID=UPI003645AA50